MGDRLFRVQNYLVGEVIGKGQFANVYVCYSNGSAKPLAARFVYKKKIENCKESTKIAFNESILCALFVHPNLIRVIDLFETRTAYVQITKLYEKSDLLTILRHSKLSYSQCIQIMKELLLAIFYLHSHHIVHRDIKLENILLTPHRHVKLGDFGLSSITMDGLMSDVCGSLPYLPPEVFSGSPFNAFQVDMWSFGVVAYTLFTRKLPYPKASSTYDYSDPINWSSIPDNVVPLLQTLLSRNPQMRPSASQALLYPIFKLKSHSLPSWDVDSCVPFPRPTIISRLAEILNQTSSAILEELAPVKPLQPPKTNKQRINSDPNLPSPFKITMPRSPSLSLLYREFGFSQSPSLPLSLLDKSPSLTQSQDISNLNPEVDIALNRRRKRGKLLPSEIRDKKSIPRLLYHLMAERHRQGPVSARQSSTLGNSPHGMKCRAMPAQVIKEAQNFLATINGCISTPAIIKREIVLNGNDGDTRIVFECFDEGEANTCTLILLKEGNIDEISQGLIDHLSKTFYVSICE